MNSEQKFVICGIMFILLIGTIFVFLNYESKRKCEIVDGDFDFFNTICSKVIDGKRYEGLATTVGNKYEFVIGG